MQVRNHVEAMHEYMHNTPFQYDNDWDNPHSLPAFRYVWTVTYITSRFQFQKHKPLSFRRSTWPKQLVAAFSRLISAVRFRQGGERSDSSHNMLLVLDERVMEYTSEWCNACNMDATNHIKIKKRLFGENASDDDRGVFRPLLNVPLASDLPLGMRLMHDTYLFIYVMCTCIAVFVCNLTTNATKQAKVRAVAVS